MRTIISCVKIISYRWKCRDIRFIHDMHKTGSYTARLWRTTNFRSIWNTLPTKLQTAKRILTKEKIDRQVAGQSSTIPFMNIKDSYNNKKVTFNMQDGLEDKIE